MTFHIFEMQSLFTEQLKVRSKSCTVLDARCGRRAGTPSLPQVALLLFNPLVCVVYWSTISAVRHNGADICRQ